MKIKNETNNRTTCSLFCLESFSFNFWNLSHVIAFNKIKDVAAGPFIDLLISILPMGVYHL